MKWVVLLLGLASVALIITGAVLEVMGNPLKDKFFGFGVLFLFLGFMPVFIYWRWDKSRTFKALKDKYNDYLNEMDKNKD